MLYYLLGFKVALYSLYYRWLHSTFFFVKFVGLLLLFVLFADSTQQVYDTESICLVVTFRK